MYKVTRREQQSLNAIINSIIYYVYANFRFVKDQSSYLLNQKHILELH